MYSTYETPFAGAVADEAQPSDKKKVVILGGGPNRIGQGIEFDYCCCHACFALQRRRLRNHHDQLQSGDGVDRLRHLGPALFRAADRRGRARDHRHRALERHAARRDRAVRRPDAAQARRGAGEGQRADPRHLARRDRSRRGPRPLQAAARQAQAAASRRTASPIRSSRRGSIADRPRLSVRDPPVLRARRPRDGRSSATRAQLERLPARHAARAGAARRQGALPERQDRADQHGARQEPAAVRPLSLRRDRGRRRLPRRRQGHLHRRHHGAHRGSRHPFRRLGLLAAAAFARRRDDRRARAADPRARARAQGRRADERAIRHQGRRHLRARSQPARLAHGAVRRQGDRPAGRQDRRAHHGRRDARELQPQAAEASTMSASRRPCSRSPASPASTPCSARR